ncbi:MAG: hypothetical protein JWM53_5338 [bacterium]|nr:hypothetical protein [bacterium]
MFVREHTRYPVELAVRMKCSTWADYLELHTSNLSRGGLFVPSEMSAPVGTGIAIELTLPNAKTVKLRGEIVHLAERAGDQIAGMGVMFLEGEATQALAEALVLAKASAPKPPPMRSLPPPIPPRAIRVAPLPVPLPLPPPPTSDGWEVPAAPAPEARAPKFADAVEQALLDELARRLELQPQEQLGVAPEASDDEIADAHYRLKERYAPSIFSRYGSSTAAVLKSINDAVDAAYARLKNPNERRALVIAAHQPKSIELTPTEQEQKRRGEEARAALRAGIERRVEEACAHRDMHRIDDAIRSFEHVLQLDRKHEFARAELAKLRDLKTKRKR